MASAEFKADRQEEIPNIPEMLEEDALRHKTYVAKKDVPPPLATTRASVDEEENCSPAFIRTTHFVVPSETGMSKTLGMNMHIVVQPFAEDARSESEIEDGADVRCGNCQGFLGMNTRYSKKNHSNYICHLCGIEGIRTEGVKIARADTREYRISPVGKMIKVHQIETLEEYVPLKRANIRKDAVIFAVETTKETRTSGFFDASLETLEKAADIAELEDVPIVLVSFGSDLSIVSRTLQKWPRIDTFSLSEERPMVFEESRTVCAQDIETCLRIFRNIEPSTKCEFHSAVRCIGEIAMRFRSSRVFFFLGSKPVEDPRKEDAVLQQMSSLSENSININILHDLVNKMALTGISTYPAHTNGEFIAARVSGKAEYSRMFGDLRYILARKFYSGCIVRVVQSNELVKISTYAKTYMEGSWFVRFPLMTSTTAVAFEFDIARKIEKHETIGVQIIVRFSDGDAVRLRVIDFALNHGDLAAVCSNICPDAWLAVAAKRMLNPYNYVMCTNIETVRAVLGGCKKIFSREKIPVPDRIKLIPGLFLGILSTKARNTAYMPPVEIGLKVAGAGCLETMRFFYPRLFSLFDYIAEVDMDVALKTVRCKRLRYEELSQEDVCILENTERIFIWFGKEAADAYYDVLIGDVRGADLEPTGSEENGILVALIAHIRAEYERFMPISIVRQGIPEEEVEFKQHLVEDMFSNGKPSYAKFYRDHMFSDIQN